MVATTLLKSIRPVTGVLAVLLLAGCPSGKDDPDDETTFAIGGSISGLSGTVVLQNNGGNNLSRSANGNFTFTTRVSAGGAYNVTVLTQPTGQNCAVSNAGGNASGNVTNVLVTCATNQYALGGTVAGLSGTLVLAEAEDGDSLAVTAAGNYQFPAKIPHGESYAVQIYRQPLGQTCSLTGVATGTATAAVSNVNLSCVNNPYTVGGTVSGLTGGAEATLQLNFANNITVGNGPFTFPKALAAGTVYQASGAIPGHTCTFSNLFGTANANVTNIGIACTPIAANGSIGGTVQGLTGTVVLRNSVNNELLTRSANGAFTFPTALPMGTEYAITVQTQPTGQICSVIVPAGNVSPQSASLVAVNCEAGTETHTVGGTVTGLKAPLRLGTINNGYYDVTPPVSGTVSYTFPEPLQFDSEFTVYIRSQPTGQTCVIPHNGTIVGHANITDIAVTCIDNVTDPLVGTYTSWDGDFALTFFAGGVYVFASNDDDTACGASKGNGVEMGVYRYNAAAGTLAFVSSVLDTNGANCGVWQAGASVVNGTVTKIGVGQATVLNLAPMAGGDLVPLVPVPALSFVPQGAFLFPGSYSFLVFGDDGRYVEVNANNDPAGNAPAGVEFGCYSFTGTFTGTFTPTLNPSTCSGAVDTDNTAGLSGSAGTAISYTVNPALGIFNNETLLFRSIPN